MKFCKRIFLFRFEAGATVLRNLMYVLSAHPDVQEKLRAEVFEKVELAEGKVTYDCVSSMEYMEMVISGKAQTQFIVETL